MNTDTASRDARLTRRQRYPDSAYEPCPRCGGRMDRGSQRCGRCFTNAERIAPAQRARGQMTSQEYAAWWDGKEG